MDSWDAIEADVAGIFEWRRDERPQERAHAYLEAHGVSRGVKDTAMQCAVMDLCRRARALDGGGGLESAVESLGRAVEGLREAVRHAA